MNKDILRHPDGKAHILYRGVSSDEFSQQFKGFGEKGGVHFPGKGIYGNGSYASSEPLDGKGGDRSRSIWRALEYARTREQRDSSLAFNPIIKRILENCFQDWVNWKTQDSLSNADRQVEEIKTQWKKEDNEKIIERAKEMFPDAKVSLYDEERGAVLIEHPADGSLAQSLLGGAMEIRSPWMLSPDGPSDRAKG